MTGIVYILGSSGFAREIRRYLTDIYGYEGNSLRIMFVDDQEDSMSVKDYQKNAISNPSGSFTILGSGRPSIKKKMLSEIKGRIFHLKHPRAMILTSEIGEGSVIAPGAVVSTDVKIGEHVLINYGSRVGHDCTIGSLSVISPGASVSGWCEIGRSVYVGANASIIERTKIGDNSIIGMGAVVLNDIPAESIVIGNPAMVFSIAEWELIKARMSSKISREQNQLKHDIELV